MVTRMLTGAVAALGMAMQALAGGPTDVRPGVVGTIDAAAIQEAATSGSVSVALPLPGGDDVVLDLAPFKVTNEDTRFVVGSRTGDIELDLDFSDMVFLRGRVSGDFSSHAFLTVSDRYGTMGRLSVGDQEFDVTSDAGPLLGLTHGEVLIRESLGLGAGPAGIMCTMETCGHTTAPAGLDKPVRIPGIRQIEVAVETDYEYFEPFGDLESAGAYMLALYAAISDIFIRDLSCTVLVTYVRLWDDPNDLWDVPNLGEFRNYWNDNMDAVHRDVAQFVSGNRFAPWGGVAYLNGLCNGNSYSVAAYSLGFYESTDGPSVFNRDITVTAHELGHNAGTPHTHDLGIDTCNDPQTTPQRGSIMAYCGQTFTGGTANHDLRFHTTVQDVIANFLATRDCLAWDCNLNGIDDLLDIADGTSDDANGNDIPDECEDCNGNGVFDDVDISNGTSMDLNANGIPDECEPDCNGNVVPDDLDISGQLDVLFVDTFETDMGWTAENLGAIDGDWERGVPVNDPDWNFDPESDSDGSGQCWVTDNAAGNSDVDDGAVRLTTNVFDLSATDAFVAYDYFLRLTMDDGDDRLLVEASNGGLGGPWTQVAVHDSNGGLDWRTHVIFNDDFVNAGVAPSSTFALRFTANDGGEQSIVEAGLDRFIIGTFAPPVSTDAYGDGIPDECEEDANADGISDYTEINIDMELDLDRDTRLDAFEDCDGDGMSDLAQIEGASNAWLTGIGQGSLRQFLSVTGTAVSDSDDAGIEVGNDIVLTEDGRLLVSSGVDSRIVAFTADGALLGDLVAPGGGGLDGPASMLLDDGRLLVASQGTDSVKAYDPETGAYLGDLVGEGAGGLVGPFAMAVGPDGSLYVSSSNHEVLAFDRTTGDPEGVHVSGKDNAGLMMARGMLFLDDGSLLVTSYGTDEIIKFAPDGSAIGKWNKNGTDTVLTLDQPWDLGWGPDGNIYVTRTHDHEGGDGHHGGAGLYYAKDNQIELHLTNARLYAFDAELGNMIRAYVVGVNSGIANPTGFVFRPKGIDCNQNLTPDSCDIASGVSQDANDNGVPDECEGFCLADFNGDGNLDILDFVDFQLAFQAGDAAADVNDDGVLNILDFVAFQIIFAAGCE